MTSTYTAEYYRSHWEDYMKPVPGNDYINLEGDLKKQMETYEEALKSFPEEIREKNLAIIRKQKAKAMAETTTAKLKETMAMIKRIKAGKASLGYTTWNQEYSAMRELVDRFEFNCLQLADFRKKYSV